MATLKSMFWEDGQSRQSYYEFSDVVVLNLTYQTNKSKVPFAQFTGVNHHMQLTLFGCALILDEMEETFVWLFKEWLKCMFNMAPKAIITSQDPAICGAFKRVFPNTRHQYCSSHIYKLATEQLGLLHLKNAELAKDYNEWYNSESIQKSERLWNILRTKYDNDKLKWLLKMYEKRSHWVPAYLRDVFTAGMTSSSQQNESMNSFFDGYVDATTSLKEFIVHYDKAIKARRHSEKKRRFRNHDFETKMRVWAGLAGASY